MRKIVSRNVKIKMDFLVNFVYIIIIIIIIIIFIVNNGNILTGGDPKNEKENVQREL